MDDRTERGTPERQKATGGIGPEDAKPDGASPADPRSTGPSGDTDRVVEEGAQREQERREG